MSLLRPGQPFRVSEDAGAIRKLWSYAKEVCKAELEAMASGDTGKAKPKANVATATAMENKAIKEAGMPVPGSDSERPSLFALTKNISVTGVSWRLV